MATNPYASILDSVLGKAAAVPPSIPDATADDDNPYARILSSVLPKPTLPSDASVKPEPGLLSRAAGAVADVADAAGRFVPSPIKAALQAPGAATGLLGMAVDPEAYWRAYDQQAQGIKPEGGALSTSEQIRSAPGLGTVLRESLSPAKPDDTGVGDALLNTAALAGDILTDPSTYLSGGLKQAGNLARFAATGKRVADVAPDLGRGRAALEAASRALGSPAAGAVYGPELIGGTARSIEAGDYAQAASTGALGALMGKGLRDELRANPLQAKIDAAIAPGLKPVVPEPAAVPEPPPLDIEAERAFLRPDPEAAANEYMARSARQFLAERRTPRTPEQVAADFAALNPPEPEAVLPDVWEGPEIRSPQEIAADLSDLRAEQGIDAAIAAALSAGGPPRLAGGPGVRLSPEARLRMGAPEPTPPVAALDEALPAIEPPPPEIVAPGPINTAEVIPTATVATSGAGVRGPEVLIAPEPIKSSDRGPERRQGALPVEDERRVAQRRALAQQFQLPEDHPAVEGLLAREAERDAAQEAAGTDPLTGLGSLRAFESEDHPALAAFDVAGLKWFNDTHGHPAGNVLLQAVGDAIKSEPGVKGFHPHGDEFFVRADTPEAAEAAARNIQERLARSEISYTTPDGTVLRWTGGRVDYGIGINKERADAALLAARERLREAGQRAPRGERPFGLAEVPAPRRDVLDQAPEVAPAVQESAPFITNERADDTLPYFRPDAEDASLTREVPSAPARVIRSREQALQLKHGVSLTVQELKEQTAHARSMPVARRAELAQSIIRVAEDELARLDATKTNKYVQVVENARKALQLQLRQAKAILTSARRESGELAPAVKVDLLERARVKPENERGTFDRRLLGEEAEAKDEIDGYLLMNAPVLYEGGKRKLAPEDPLLEIGADGKEIAKAIAKDGDNPIYREARAKYEAAVAERDADIEFNPEELEGVKYATRPAPGQRGLPGLGTDVPEKGTKPRGPEQRAMFGGEMLQGTEARTTEGREGSGPLFTQDAKARARKEKEGQGGIKFATRDTPRVVDGRIDPAELDSIPRGVLSLMARRLKAAGYDVRGADDVLALMKRRDGNLTPDFARAYKDATATKQGTSASERHNEYARQWLATSAGGDARPKGKPGIALDVSRPDGSGELVFRDESGVPRGVIAFDGQGVVHDMAVDPSLRRSGIATRLLTEARERHGIKAVTGPFSEAGLRTAKAAGLEVLDRGTRFRARNVGTPEQVPTVSATTIKAAFAAGEVKELRDGAWDVSLPGDRKIQVRVRPDGIEYNKAAFEQGYKREIGEGEQIVGAWQKIDKGGLVFLAKQADAGTVLHESFHAGMDLALTPKEKAAVLKHYGDEEKAAEAFAKWQPAKQVNSWFSKIAQFFRKVYRTLSPSWESAFERVRSGEAYALPAKDGRLSNNARAASDARFSTSAYHGSPHDFDKFDSSKIGTGEGAQAYGHGLYFSGKKDVAEYYRKSLAGPDFEYLDPDVLRSKKAEFVEKYSEDAYGSALYWLNATKGDVKRAAALARNRAENYRGTPDEAADRHAGNLLTQLSMSEPLQQKRSGKTYEVELAPDEGDFLDWDKPLSEQGEKVKAALGGLNQKAREHSMAEWGQREPTGRTLYDQLTGGRGDNGGFGPGKQGASMYLKSLGIPGIRYQDAGSRTAPQDAIVEQHPFAGWTVRDKDNTRIFGIKDTKAEAETLAESLRNPKQSHNYVVFDDSLVTTKAKYATAPETERPRGVDRGAERTAFATRREQALLGKRVAEGERLGQPFADSKLPHVQHVRVIHPDGYVHYDAIKGLNRGHALAKAEANWSGSKIEPLTEGEFEYGVNLERTLGDIKDEVLRKRDESEARFARPKYATAPKMPPQAGKAGPQAVPPPAPRPATPFSIPEETALQKFQRKIQDKFNRIGTVQKAVKEQGGRVREETDVAEAIDAFGSKVAERLADVDRSYVDPLVKGLAKSKAELTDLADYMSLLHAPERDAYVAQITDGANQNGSGWKPQEANARWSELEQKYGSRQGGRISALESHADIVRQMRDKQLDVLVDGGLLSQQQAAAWRRDFKDYVPLRHVETDEGMGTGQGFDIRGREAKQITGRSTKAENPIAFMLQQYQKAIVRAEKNKVDQRLAKLVGENPDKSLWEIDAEHTRKERGADGKVREVRDQRAVMEDHHFKIDGEAHRITVKDPLMKRALQNMSAQETGDFVRKMGTATRLYSQLVTTWAPEFMFTNFARDIQTAVANLGTEQGGKIAGKTVKKVVPSMRAMWRVLRDPNATGKMAQFAREFREDGGSIGFYNLKDIPSLQKTLESKIKTAGEGALPAVRRAAIGFKEYVEQANKSVENGTRLAAYVTLREAGATRQKAAQVARNLTVNFTKKGEAGPAMNALYAFFNANVQGTKRLLEVLGTKRGAAMAGSIIGLGAVMDTFNRAAAGDDNDDGTNDYDAIPEYVKERNLVFMRGKGKAPILFPMPYGYNVLHNLGRQTTSAVSGAVTPGRAAASLASAAWNSFNPLGGEADLVQTLSPTMLDPLVQDVMNKDFTGKNIRPEKYPGDARPPSELFYKNVPPLARDLAKGLNSLTGGDKVTPGFISVSPETIDHYFTFASGGLGRFGSNVANAGASLAKGEAPSIRNVPLARRFVYEERPGASAGKYRENREELDQAYDRYKTYRKERDADGLKSLPMELLKAKARLDAYDKAIRRLKDYPESEARDRKIEELQTKANKLFALAMKKAA